MELKYATVATILNGATLAEITNYVTGATVTSTASDDILNELGDQDWQLVSQTSFTNADGSTLVLNTIFCRRVS